MKGKGGKGRMLFGILVGAVAACAVLWGYNTYQTNSAHSSGKTDIDLTVLKESMESNNELSTEKYLYTDSVSITNQNTLGIIGRDDIKLPFTDATYILQFDGTIKAGYDLDEATVSQEGDSTVVITLPPAKVLSHETGDVSVVYEQQNIANPLHAGEDSDWIEQQKATMETRAESLGLFDEAQQNAKVTFESLFASALPEGTTLDVRFQEND